MTTDTPSDALIEAARAYFDPALDLTVQQRESLWRYSRETEPGQYMTLDFVSGRILAAALRAARADSERLDFPAVPVPPSPICGHCGNPLSEHFHEREIYCNDRTTGDVYTDTPRNDILADWLECAKPELFAEFVAAWKRAHGQAIDAARRAEDNK